MDWAAPQTRRARAELSRLIEPGDLFGAVLIQLIGPEDAHRLIVSGQWPGSVLQQQVAEVAEEAGLGPRQRRLTPALQRWRLRLGQLHGAEDIDAMARMGGGILVPEDEAWPEALRDLQSTAPIALWFRTARSAEGSAGGGSGTFDGYQRAAERMPRRGRSVALVGSREMTDYGGRAAFEIAQDLAAHGVCVVSGGAYGIDAAAHRGALAGATHSNARSSDDKGPAATIAVMAGGLDSLYPAGNEGLLRAVCAYGLLLSELPPGSSPQRHRFLHRNRVIAALSETTVVLEARTRSGALSTANHALTLDRPVGVLPGSIYSASAAGCHRLLQTTPAQLITDAADIMELSAGQSLDGKAVSSRHQQQLPISSSSEPEEGRANCVEERSTSPEKPGAVQKDPLAGLSEVDQRIYDALPVHRLAPPGKLAEVAGVPLPLVLGGLSRLERRGLARGQNGRWAISRSANYGGLDS